MKSIGVIPGYAIDLEADLFEICNKTETLLKLTKIDNSFHIQIIVRKNQGNVSDFMQNSAKKLPKNTIIYIKHDQKSTYFLASETPFPI